MERETKENIKKTINEKIMNNYTQQDPKMEQKGSQQRAKNRQVADKIQTPLRDTKKNQN